ncbi:MAG: HAD-IA family hydrolase [Succinivibrio sp.]
MKLDSLPEAMLFDLDGTLADTIPQLALAARTVAEKSGIVIPSLETVKGYVGNGVNLLLSRVIAGHFDVGADEVDPEVLKKARAIFNDVYTQGLNSNFRVYDGVKEGLAYFKSLGIKLGVVTNKPQIFAIPLLGYMGLSDYFDCILGGEVLEKRKPDPLPVLYVLEQLNVHSDNVLMVGDSDNDIIAGNSACISTVFFTYGYNRSDVTKLKYDYKFDSFTELTALVKELKG